jgi:hypothetical protein
MSSPHVAVVCWRSIHSICYMRTAQRRFRQMLRTAIDPLAIYERIVRSRRNRACVRCITVIVVVRRYAVGVANISVMHIHVVPVVRTGVIPRVVSLTPSKREPSMSVAEPETKSDSESKTAAT